jgi:hypothetical protein
MQLKEPNKFEAEILTTINIKGSHELICEFLHWCYDNRIVAKGGGVGPFWAYGSYSVDDTDRVVEWLKDRKCHVRGEQNDNQRLD